jgi:4-oxalocrotonate tautomerase
MPLVQVHIIENTFTEEQKQQVHDKLTEAMLSIEGENMREVTWVVIEEWKSSALSIGGRRISSDMSRSRAAGKTAAKSA